jgi:hypothetical protein
MTYCAHENRQVFRNLKHFLSPAGAPRGETNACRYAYVFISRPSGPEADGEMQHGRVERGGSADLNDYGELIS